MMVFAASGLGLLATSRCNHSFCTVPSVCDSGALGLCNRLENPPVRLNENNSAMQSGPKFLQSDAKDSLYYCKCLIVVFAATRGTISY